MQQQTGAGALRGATGTPGTALSPASTAAQYLTKHRSQLEAALPKHLNADRMIRLAMTSFSQNSALANCELKSVFASVVLASQMGLEIGVAGQGYLVPYKNKCTFIPGWQGLVDLVNRAGRASVWTGAVFEGDVFEWALGDRPFIRHQPQGEDNPAKLVFVYAVGRVNGSEWPVIEVWGINRIVRHRDKMNKVGNRHYSYDNMEMYARKIPLLQVLKYMPKSIELQNAIAATEAAEQGQSVTLDGDFITITPDDDNAPQGTQQKEGPAPAQREAASTSTEQQHHHAGTEKGNTSAPQEKAAPAPAGGGMTEAEKEEARQREIDEASGSAEPPATPPATEAKTTSRPARPPRASLD